MKKSNPALVFAASALLLTGVTACNNSREFTVGKATKAIEQLSEFQDSAHVCSFTIGYYELNSAEARLRLRQLAANDMITYSAEQVNEYIPAYYWYPARTVEHVFVNVALTDKGTKLIVREPYKDYEADELRNPNSSKEYPENTVELAETITLLNPAEGEPGETTHETEYAAENKEESDITTETAMPQTARKDYLAESRMKESTITLDMLAYQLKVTKIRNIVCNEEDMRAGKAHCEAIIEVKNATPFGRILEGVEDGDRQLKSYAFTYYIDCGWQVVR